MNKTEIKNLIDKRLYESNIALPNMKVIYEFAELGAKTVTEKETVKLIKSLIDIIEQDNVLFKEVNKLLENN